jgi:hypothetical protein
MQDSFAGLALQNFLIFLFAISSFPWLHHQHSHQTSNGGAGAIRAATNQSVHSRSSSRRLLTANAAGVGTAGANDGNQANLSRRQSANSFTSRSIESTHRWVKLRNFLDFMWTYSIRLMLQYAYLISLIVIYVSLCL